jgi:hypothetical protein
MSSNKKTNQPSILSFFNNATNNSEGSKKRNFTEMMRGENNDKFVNLSIKDNVIFRKKLKLIYY